MALKDLLDEEIQKNLSSDEKNFYGLDDAIAAEQEKTTSNFSVKAFNIIQATISQADKISIDELELRLTRLNNLKKYTKQANLGDTEENLILGAISKAESALDKQLSNKKSFFRRANKLISQSTIDMGALLIGISAGDPLVALGVKLAGDYMRSRKERKLARAQEKKETFRGDAEAIKSAAPETSAAPEPTGSPLVRAPFSESSSSSGSAVSSEDSGRMVNLLQDIFMFTEEISDDVKKLLSISQTEQAARQGTVLDNVESSLEKGGPLKQDKKSTKAASGEKGIIGGIASLLGFGGAGSAGKLLMMIGKYGLIAGAAGTVLYGAYDILSSYFKTGEFGGSDTEKLIRSLDEQLIGVLGGLGEGAKAGAVQGSAILPFGGTIVGGLLGMMMESLTGWLGDSAPDLGASNPFQAGIFAIFDIILTTVNGMLKATFDAIESIVSKIPGYETLGINEALSSARKSLLGLTEPASASLSKNQTEATEKTYKSKEEQLDYEFKTRTGEFKNTAPIGFGDTEEQIQSNYQNKKKILGAQKKKAMGIAQKQDAKAPSAPPSSGGSTASPIQSKAPESGSTSKKIGEDKGKAILLASMDKAGITDPTERAAFMAQMSHESMGYTRMEEMASGAAYEGKRGLGNNQPGDGKRYKGRGFVQLTGRSNYQIFGNKIGLDLVNNPQWAADPNVAGDVAIAYWQARVKPKVSNFSDIEASTKAINGGLNGFDDRKRRFAKTLNDPSITSVGSAPTPQSTAPTALASAASPAISTTSGQVNNAQQSLQATQVAQAGTTIIAPTTNNNVVAGGGAGQSGTSNIRSTTQTGSGLAANGLA